MIRAEHSIFTSYLLNNVISTVIPVCSRQQAGWFCGYIKKPGEPGVKAHIHFFRPFLNVHFSKTCPFLYYGETI